MTRGAWILPLLLMVTVSCGGGDESSLQVSLSNSQAFLIGSSSSSCVARKQAQGTPSPPAADISSYYFMLSSPRIKWNASGMVEVFSIRVKIRSNKLQSDYTCSLSPEEIEWTFAEDFDDPWNRRIAANSEVDVNSLCVSIKCGGLQLANPNETFSAIGEVQVDGALLDENGEASEPVTARTTLTIVKP